MASEKRNSEPTEAPSQHMIFPDQLTGSIDLSKIIRELTALNESLHQATIRTPGNAVQLPKTTKTLEELASLNKVSLLDTNHREQLLEALKTYHDHAPQVHISFASEPSGAFTRKITSWMRTNVNPVVLVEIGLQPTIAAGCMLRTTNKLFDMSLRSRFDQTRPILLEKLTEAAVK